jgi:hypothetical protein
MFSSPTSFSGLAWHIAVTWFNIDGRVFLLPFVDMHQIRAFLLFVSLSLIGTFKVLTSYVDEE